MTPLTEIVSYREACRDFSWDRVWDLFDGDRDHLNIAHECIDRHPPADTALRIKFEDGHRETYSFADLQVQTSRFANYLHRLGVGKGERVAVMLQPSLDFYGAMFGAMKRGAIAVPLFTLFGPEALAMRLKDCQPAVLIVEPGHHVETGAYPGLRIIEADGDFRAALERESGDYTPHTAAHDLALFQYTSGTTREMPDAIKHSHRTVVTLMVAALFGMGHRHGDRFFAPSSPAWGHGLAHSTLSPLALGIGIGAYSGKFDPIRVLEALEEFQITNFSAAPTVHRMIKNTGKAADYKIHLEKISFTGEPMDSATAEFIEQTFGVPACSMFGTTEVGAFIGNFPGFSDFTVKQGAMGVALPGHTVEIQDDNGQRCAPGQLGEIMIRRRNAWFPVKDRGHQDEDGYIFHAGRSDDVIISAGWTMSAVEIEDVLLKHPDIREAAVVGVPDTVRGLIPKAFIVAGRSGAAFEAEIKAFMKARLSKHEYPRAIAFVEELPKTPVGKINRKVLREQPTA